MTVINDFLIVFIMLSALFLILTLEKYCCPDEDYIDNGGKNG